MTKDVEQIYQKIQNSIVMLKLKPGDRLREIEVSEQFNVSRTPIRDVFKKLEQDGLLEIHSQSGSFVTKIDLKGITDLMYVRSSVEYQVLLGLMGKLSTADFDKMRSYLTCQKELADKNATNTNFANKYFSLDNDFHQFIYKKANQSHVLDLLNNNFPSFQRYRFLTFLRDDAELNKLSDIHSAMVDCLEQHNTDDLRNIVYVHNYSGLTGIDKVKERHPDYFLDD